MPPAQHMNDNDHHQQQQEQEQLAASQIHAMQQQTFLFTGGSSSGWRGMWLVGVAQALKEREFDLSAYLIGESNGALISAALVLGDKDVFRTIRDSALSQYEASETHNASVLGRFHSETFLFDCMKRHANLHKFKELNSTPGRLTVVYSSLSAMKTRRTAEFESEDQLEQVLLASCSVTPSRLNGEWVIDATVFGNQEVLANDCGTPTIQVNASFSSNADIKPSRYIPQLWSVMPPSREDIAWLFDLGYEDGLQWIQSQSLLLLDGKTSSKSSLALVPPPHTAHRYSGNAGTIAWFRTVEHTPSVLFNVVSQTWKWFALYLMLKLSFPGPRRTQALKAWKAADASPGTTHLTSKMAQWRVVNWLRSFLLAGADNASKQITGVQ